MDLAIFSQAKMNSGLGMIVVIPCLVMVRFVYKLISLLFCFKIKLFKFSLGENVMKIELMDWKGKEKHPMPFTTTSKCQMKKYVFFFFFWFLPLTP